MKKYSEDMAFFYYYAEKKHKDLPSKLWIDGCGENWD